MGRLRAGEPSPGDLDQRRPETLHKLVGVKGCMAESDRAREALPEQNLDGEVRQYHCGVLPQQAGRHQVWSNDGPDLGPREVVPSTEYRDAGSTCGRGQQQIGGLLSRKRVNTSEWQLDHETVQDLFRRWGRLNIELFAIRQNAQLHTFCCWRRDAQAYAIDSLAIPWMGMEAYAFPPIALVSKVLAKLKNHQCWLILIAPWWPKGSDLRSC